MRAHTEPTGRVGSGRVEQRAANGGGGETLLKTRAINEPRLVPTLVRALTDPPGRDGSGRVGIRKSAYACCSSAPFGEVSPKTVLQTRRVGAGRRGSARVGAKGKQQALLQTASGGITQHMVAVVHIDNTSGSTPFERKASIQSTRNTPWHKQTNKCRINKYNAQQTQRQQYAPGRMHSCLHRQV